MRGRVAGTDAAVLERAATCKKLRRRAWYTPLVTERQPLQSCESGFCCAKEGWSPSLILKFSLMSATTGCLAGLAYRAMRERFNFS